ncbi:MAG: alpha-glucosidase [Butyrivibrio sp.]|nr:alpha-glucosidase [Butyrivibrio sp.]
MTTNIETTGEKDDWYREKSFYQIWIRSFMDGNGDGIGDLYGVYNKLDYIKSLGVDGIWFSPIYPSPNADYGYDISDYKNIHPDYGNMDQFKRVLNRAHELGLKVVMDLVVNHTSDEHPWFVESCKSRNNPYSDYYIWRDHPNNWESLFEGKAWEYVPERDQYYLHLFARKQPDLNMDNPKVREEVKSIMRFWLDLGVDGFREDVITFISKREGLPNALPIPYLGAMRHYKDGPHIHEYLREFREVVEPYHVFQVGEAPMTTVDTALSYLTGPNKSLDMMISFDHMMADCMFTEYIHRPFSLVKYKKALSKWQTTLAAHGAWNALYIENHDHPRIVSRYGSEFFQKESAKALAASYLFLQGTPFIYQGQEIGMTNIRLKSIDDYVDVSTKTNYAKYHLKDTVEKRLERIHHSSRDSARTPMQWSDEEYAGFSTVHPWFHINENYHQINVTDQERDPNSVLQFYRRCLALRKKERTLLYGRYREYEPDHPFFYIYERAMKGERFLIICSFSTHRLLLRLPKPYRDKRGSLVLCSYPTMPRIIGGVPQPANFEQSLRGEDERLHFRPYESRMYRFDSPIKSSLG